MPWTKRDYPDSMKNLPDDVRCKAIEIANALLDEDYSEGRSIAIGIAQARKYVEGDDERRPEYHVKSDHDEWVLLKENSDKPIMHDQTKEALLDKAKEYVNEHDGSLVVHKVDGSVSHHLYEE